MDYKKLKSLSKMAQGLKKCELVLKNARLINVFTNEVKKTDIAISEGIIAGIGDSYSGEDEIEMYGKFVSPGFIDAHVHLESGMISPSEFVSNALKFGTTTYIADPHEAANVSGFDGIDYMISQTEDIDANVYFMMPSCVPVTPFEDNGCILDADQMAKYIDHPRMLGLGEVMDFKSVLSCEESMVKKLDLFKNTVIDGHAPGLSNKKLNAYALAGISTNHENALYEQALKQRRLGFTILVRQGSAAKNLEAIVRGMIRDFLPTEGFCFCTDDKHIEEIRREGHISFNIKKAISLGLDPIYAIRMATINTANCYGLKHLGAIAPGRQADMVVLNDLRSVDIDSVYFKGKLVPDKAENARYELNKVPEKIKNTVNIKRISRDELKLKCDNSPQYVLELVNNQITTKMKAEILPSNEGVFKPNSEFNKVAVIERHHATGKIGLAALKNFGIKNGAMATTVAHDSHNLIVAGDNDKDMLKAINELKRTGGGYTIVSDSEVLKTLEFPIMGLISDKNFNEINPTIKKMIDLLHSMGVNMDIDPFITLSFISLPAIPQIRLTARGLFDVENSRFLN